MSLSSNLPRTAAAAEPRVAVLVDCDNTSPEVLDYTLRVVARFGRVVLRRGYGNHATLAHRWQEALVRQAFTPCLQYQYAAGKNTSDIALALDAMEALFDDRADTFCLVTSDSDFAYLCRKLRERGATVHIVGEAKSPDALRNASDQFFEWARPVPVSVPEAAAAAPSQPFAPARPPVAMAAVTGVGRADAARAVPAPAPPPSAAATVVKRRPLMVVEAVRLMAADTPEGKVHLGPLGQYLRRTDPAFSPQIYGHSGLLDMLRTYDRLAVQQEVGGYWTVRLGHGGVEPSAGESVRQSMAV
ncbi:NYN domain-containing protein [Pseudaquabacterium rugosum]|uniref:NYN domain-containing protein n=1 Tax=Pseudaquabacterium rugosum TaxID=2984194 RepID=A0ABU9BF21_9BURK